MKTINFCIPFIGPDLRCTEFLISNLLSTAAHPERISISLSVHSLNDMELIKNSSFNHAVNNIVMARAYRAEELVMGGVVESANYCSAIQSLCEQAAADVVIFSKETMAFLVKGWDTKIVEVLETQDLCGVEYQNHAFPIMVEDVIPMQLYVSRYQKIPNLNFLAMSKRCLENYFPNGLSSFHHFLANGGVPIQVVHTTQMANALHLPWGSMWMMDNSFEIPFVIQNNQLKYQAFNFVAFEQQTIFSADIFTGSPVSGNVPELFVDNISGEPFLTHYGKTNNAPLDDFIAAVDGYLAS